ncbi:Flavin carrier protein 2 [Candidozyma auris]
MIYSFLKCLFVAVLQKQGRVQSVIIFAIELIYCVLVCWIRPFMDKRTNIFNITIAVINTINALFYMFFSYVFGQPQVVASVMAVVYFVLNAVFALYLLLFTIITCVLALVYKNPDTRYQPMKDDRVSFLPRIHHKGASQNSSDPDDIELVALGASAMKGHENGGKPIYDDESVYDDDSSQTKRGNGFVDTESYSKNSLSVESAEPQQPASTIVGNSTNAYTGFQTQYNGRDETPYLSDNIDFLAESPKEFFLNLDEKIDDKMMNIADKWEEAKNMPAVIEPDIYRETSEVLVDEVEDSDVSVDYDGYQD